MLTVKIQLKQLILKFRVCEDSNHQGKSPFSCLSGLFVFGFHIPSYSAYCILMDLLDAISQWHTNILIMFTKQEKDNKKTLSNSRNNLAEKSQVYLYQYIDKVVKKQYYPHECKCNCCQKRQKMCCIQIRRGHPSKRSVI